MQNTGVVFALVRDRKILMQQRDGNCTRFPFKWCIPGGGTDGNETPEQTLLREVKEEYNLDLKLEQCSFLMDSRNGYNKVYVCNVAPDQEPIMQEGLAMKWMLIEEIEKMELGFNQEKIVAELKKVIL